MQKLWLAMSVLCVADGRRLAVAVLERQDLSCSMGMAPSLVRFGTFQLPVSRGGMQVRSWHMTVDVLVVLCLW
jgi:uncharacterized protein YdiU (UPF0061 family)